MNAIPEPDDFERILREVQQFEPADDHYPRWLTIAIWTAAFVGGWAFVGAVYALGRATWALFA